MPRCRLLRVPQCPGWEITLHPPFAKGGGGLVLHLGKGWGVYGLTDSFGLVRREEVGCCPMNSRTFFATVAVLSVIVLAALSAALPSALLPGNTAYAQTNSAPQFPSSETGTRTVDENTPWYQNIGDPVVATDPDDDKLTYSLENARTSPFTIDRFTGQLQTGAPLDYETQATYTAKVIAADRLEPDDPSRATDTITVTINVNNVDEPGEGLADVDQAPGRRPG